MAVDDGERDRDQRRREREEDHGLDRLERPEAADRLVGRELPEAGRLDAGGQVA